MRVCFAVFLLSLGCVAQSWDVPAYLGKSLSKASNEKLKLTFEQRLRTETRQGVNFGKDPDATTGLERTRLGLAYRPYSWLKVSGMVQDTRAPWYGPNAPNNVRDSADLHEAYFELRPEAKHGFGLTAGRAMLNFGDGRLIGTPQWGNNSRTYDHLRAGYRLPGAQLEMIYVTQVKVRIDEFNKPAFGDRVWGMYNVLPDIVGKSVLDVYILRRDQNRTAGFTGGSTKLGTDRLGVNTFGARFAGPLTASLKFSMEGAAQSGHVGPADHSAAAWVSSMARRWTLGKHSLDALAEYKFASGSANPQDATHSGTFDQLYAANHDRFGHQDLIGWRNIQNVKLQGTFGFTKQLSGNLLWGDFWLASARDALYGGTGKALARSADGSAGRHAGHEFDAFLTQKFKRFTFGAGGGYFMKGEFVRRTTPDINPLYGYVFYSYSI